MARCFGECSVQCHRKITVERRVQSVVEHVENAERLIARACDEKLHRRATKTCLCRQPRFNVINVKLAAMCE